MVIITGGFEMEQGWLAGERYVCGSCINQPHTLEWVCRMGSGVSGVGVGCRRGRV